MADYGMEIARGWGEGIEAKKKRTREDTFASWLQGQGLAPGAPDMPEGGGAQFQDFLKAGGLTGFQETERAKREGAAYGEALDRMATQPDFSEQQRATISALSSGIKTGKLRPEDYRASVQEILKYGMMPGLPGGEGAAPSPEEAWKYQPVKTYSSTTGKAGMEFRPIPPAAIAHGERLLGAGIKPGTPEWKASMANFMGMTSVEGRGTFGTSDVAMPRTQAATPGDLQPLVPSDKPVPHAVSGALGAGRMLVENIGSIENALKDPTVLEFLGPVAKHRAEATRWAQEAKRFVPDIEGLIPKGLDQPLPANVIELERNLASLQNYVVKLITGAQMSEPEAQRIIRQLPTMHHAGPEFQLRLEGTKRDITMLQDTIRQLSLTGNQKAKLAAEEFGLTTPQAPVPPAARQPAAPVRQGVGTSPTAPAQPKTAVTGGAAGVAGTPFGRWKAQQRPQ